MANKKNTNKEVLRRVVKVAGYIIVSTLVSEAVVFALREFVDIRMNDQYLAGLINVMLITATTMVREGLKKDSRLKRIL